MEIPSKRVRVVDCEQVIANSVVEIVGEYGYEAMTAYSGDSALELVQQQCPDIIMPDVIMPKMMAWTPRLRFEAFARKRASHFFRTSGNG